MSNRNVFYAMLTLGLLAAPCLPAQEGQAPAPAPQERQAQAESVVGKALEAMQGYATEKRPDTHARYYIYLQSAGWCGPATRRCPRLCRSTRRCARTAWSSSL